VCADKQVLNINCHNREGGEKARCRTINIPQGKNKYSDGRDFVSEQRSFGVDPTCFNVCHGLTWIGVDKNNPNYKSSDGVLYDRERTMIIRCPPRKNYSNINQ